MKRVLFFGCVYLTVLFLGVATGWGIICAADAQTIDQTATIDALVGSIAGGNTKVTDSVEGVYTADGVNQASGDHYQAVVEIKGETKDVTTYYLRWTLAIGPNGEELTQIGYGYMSGGRLIVIIQDQQGSLCLADYTPNADSAVWSGTWSPAGSGVLSTETLTKSDKSAEVLKELLPRAETRTL